MQPVLNAFLSCFCLFYANASLALVQPAVYSVTIVAANIPVDEAADVVYASARVEHLLLESARLVNDARSGKSPASQFRIEVTFYREGLRELMLENRRKIDKKARIPDYMLLDMVRMSALLHSAAECKTGRFIVCPADLMIRLTSQQALLSQQWSRLKADAERTG